MGIIKGMYKGMINMDIWCWYFRILYMFNMGIILVMGIIFSSRYVGVFFGVLLSLGVDDLVCDMVNCRVCK